MIRRSLEAGLLPSSLGNDGRVKIDRGPPSNLVSVPVEGTMVGATEGDCEFIADPTAQCARLHEAQVVSVRRPSSAHDAR
jgi:hypothetical protein